MIMTFEAWTKGGQHIKTLVEYSEGVESREQDSTEVGKALGAYLYRALDSAVLREAVIEIQRQEAKERM